MADIEKTIKVNADTQQANKQISDVIKKIEEPVKLEIDADVRDAISSIKELQNMFKALTNQTKDGQKLRINIAGIGKVQEQLTKLGETLTEVSNKISFDNIRPPKAVEASIESVTNKIQELTENEDKLKKLETYLTGAKGKAGAKNLTLGYDFDGLERYVSKLREFSDLGGDLARTEIKFKIEDAATGEIEKTTISLKDLISLIEDTQDKKLGINVNESVKSVKELEAELQNLKTELKQSQAKQDREFTVGLDESSIQKITEAVEKLNSVIGDTDGKTLGIDEASLNKIVSAIENIKDSFNGIKFDENATLGFKPEQIEAITISFENLQSVLEDIHSLLSSFDVPKFDIPDVPKERKPRREIRKVITTTDTGEDDTEAGKIKGIKVEPDATDFIKQIQEQVAGENVEVNVKPITDSFAEDIKNAIGEVEVKIKPFSQSDISKAMSGWSDANKIMDSFDIATNERLAIFNGDTGYISNSYIYDTMDEISSDLIKKVVDDAKGQANSMIHTHPTGVAAFSPEDISLAITALNDGITKNYVMGLNEVSSVDFSSVPQKTLLKIEKAFSNRFEKISDEAGEQLKAIGQGNNPLAKLAIENSDEYQNKIKQAFVDTITSFGLNVESIFKTISPDEFIKSFNNAPNVSERIGDLNVEINAAVDNLRGQIEAALTEAFDVNLKANTDSLRSEIESSLTNPFEIEIQPSGTLVDTINKMLEANGAFNIDIGATQGANGVHVPGTSGKNPYQMIYEMVSADEWMRKNLIAPNLPTKDKEITELLKERMMIFDSKTGKHTNPYIFDKHSSTRIGRLLHDQSLDQGTFDTGVHTHPETFAHMSINNKGKKDTRYSGDLTSYKSQLDNYKIAKQIIATQKDVQMFDAEQFFKDYEKLFKDDNTEQKTLKTFTKNQKNHLRDFEGSLDQSLEIIDYVNKFGDGFALNLDSLSSMFPSYTKGDKKDFGKRFRDYAEAMKKVGDYDNNTDLRTAILDFLTEDIGSKGGYGSRKDLRENIAKEFDKTAKDGKSDQWAEFVWDNFFRENNGQRIQDVTLRSATKAAWKDMGVDWDKYVSYIPIEDFKKQFAGAVSDNGGVDMSQFMGQPFNVNVNFDDVPDKLREAIEGGAPYKVEVSTDTTSMQQVIQGGIDAGAPYKIDSIQLGTDIQLAEKIQENIDSFEFHVNPKLDPASDLVKSIQDTLNNAELKVNLEKDSSRNDLQKLSDATQNINDQTNQIIDNKSIEEAEHRFNNLNRLLNKYSEESKKMSDGDYTLLPMGDAKYPGRVSASDIRQGNVTKASIKRILNDYLKYKKRLDTGEDELGYSLSDEDQNTNKRLAESYLNELTSYVSAYKDMEEAAKIFGKTHQDVFQQVQEKITKAREAADAYNEVETSGRAIMDILGQYGIDKMTYGQFGQLKETMAAGDIEAFAAKVKELFGVEIPTSVEKAREAVSGFTSDTESQLPQTTDQSGKREQDNQSEVASVEQLISEYERLKGVLESIESKYNDKGIPLGEDRDRWDDADKKQKEISDKLRKSGMYYSLDQDKWVEDTINLEDKYKELLSLIDSGDKKSISDMFQIDEGDLEDLEVLKNNLKLVIDTLNSNGMDASKAELSWWNGWLSGGRDLLDTNELTGAFNTLGIKPHYKRDTGGTTYKPSDEQDVRGGRYVSSSSEISEDTESLNGLIEKLVSVTQAVDEKTNAFRSEGEVVSGTVQEEISMLTALEGWIVMISQDLDKLSDGLKNLPEIGSQSKTDENNSVFGKDLLDNLARIQTAFKDLNPDTVTAFTNALNNISFNKQAAQNIDNLTNALTRLIEKMQQFGQEDFSNTPLSSINDLVGKADALKDLAKILEASTEKIKAVGGAQKDEQKYDDTEMKRRANEIDKRINEKIKESDDEALVSLERMYDSHDNLKQAILTMKKRITEKDGREYDQIEKWNVHWNEKGEEAYSSRMTKDEYEKSQKEYERYLRNQMSVYERLTKEQARRENIGSTLTESENAQLTKAKKIIEEINSLKRQGLDITKAQQEAADRATAADQKAAQIRQDYKDNQQKKDADEKDRKQKIESDKKDKETAASTKDQIEEYFETIKKAEEAQSQLNEALADSYKGSTSLDDVKALRDEVQRTGDAAEEAKNKIEGLLNDQSSGLTDKEIGKYRKKLEDQYDRSLLGSDSSLKKLKKAQRKQFEEETKNDLYDYLNSRQTYQKLFQKSLGGQNTYDDNGKLVSSSSLSADEITQINNAMTTIVAQEQNWNSAKVQGITLTQKQADAVKLLKDASEQMNDDGSFNENYTKGILEQSAMQQEAMSQYAKLEKQITKMYDQTEWRKNAGDWETQVDSLKENLRSIGTMIGDIDNESDLREVLDNIKELSAQRQALSKSTEWMPIAQDWKESTKTNILKWMDQNKMAAREYHEELQKILDDIDEIGSKAGAEQINSRFQAVQGDAAANQLLGKSLGDRFRDQFSNTMTSLATYYLSFQDFIRYGRQAISVVRELDTALTEVRKVSDESYSSLKDWQVSTFDQANSVGGSAKQLQESTASWLRLGKSFDEAQEAAQASVKLLNVSEFTNIDDATTSLVSMRQAFEDLTYEDFIDKLNGVGDNFSSSTDQLAQGMQNVSSVLKVAGNDIDQSLALLTAANDITQDMSKASMGVRTIALRISGTQDAKEQLEELGEDTSDFIVQTQSKVDEKVRRYTATASNPNGVSVLDENGRLRSTYDILLDISQVYDEIVAKDNAYGTNTSNALLELLAGKTRSNILASILQNPDLLKESYEQSQNSQGIGQRELDIYLDSVEAHIARLQNRLQELAYVSIDSDSLKTLIDLLTLAVQAATALSKAFGGVNLVIGAAFTAFAKIKKNGPSLLDYDPKRGFGGILMDVFKGDEKQTKTSTKTDTDSDAEVDINVKPNVKLDKNATKSDGEKIADEAKDQVEQAASDQAKKNPPTTTVLFDNNANDTAQQAKETAEELEEGIKQATDEAKTKAESEPTSVSPTINVDGKNVNADQLDDKLHQVTEEAKAEAETGTGVDIGGEPGVDFTDTGRESIKKAKKKKGWKKKKAQKKKEQKQKDTTTEEQLKEAEKSAEETTDAMKKANEQADEFSEKTKDASENMTDMSDDAEATGDALDGVTDKVDNMSNGFSGAKKEASDLKNEVKDMGDATEQASEGASKIGKAFSSLGSGIKNIAGQFVSIAANMAIATAASMAVSAIYNGIKYVLEYDENIIKKGQEAEATIRDINEAYAETESKTKSLGERYNELRKGVTFSADGNAVANVKLTEDEYEEFLSINNQLADLYPELISGQDAQGNSLVDLGDNAKTATDKLNEYLAVQKDIANYEIASNMQDVINGIVKENKQLDEQLEDLDAQKNKLNAIASPEEISDNAFVVGIDIANEAFKEYGENLEGLIDKYAEFGDASITIADVFTTNELGEQIIDLNKVQFIIDGEDKAKQEIIKDLSDMFGDSVRQFADESEQFEFKASSILKQKADNWSSNAPAVAQAIQSGLTYRNLVGSSEELQSALDKMLKNVDYGQIFLNASEAQQGNFIPYLRDLFIYSFDKALDQAGEVGTKSRDKMQQNIQDLLTFDSSNMTYAQMRTNLDDLLNQIFPNDYELQKNIRIALGFTYIDETTGQEIEVYKRNDLNKQIMDNLKARGYYGNVDVASALTEKEANIVLQGIRNGEVKLPTGLPSDLTDGAVFSAYISALKNFVKEKLEAEQEIEKTGTLSDILGNEEFKTRAEGYESNLSSLTSALQTLRDEGSLTAETMKDLQSKWPDMTDFSEKGIQKYATDELKQYINEFKESWTDFSPEGIEQLDSYLKNLIGTYKDVEVSAQDARSEILKTLFNDNKELGSNMATEVAQSQYAEAINRLTDSFGEDLNWNIVLALKDQFSGDLDDLVRRYSDYALYWTIYITNQKQLEDLATSLTELQTEQSKIEEGITYRENRGLKKTVKQYDKLLDNSKDQVKNIRQQNKLLKMQQNQIRDNNGEIDTTSKAYKNIQSQIDANNSTLRSLIESQREYQMNAGTVAAQNVLDTITKLQTAMNEGNLGADTLQSLIKDMPSATDAMFHTTSGQYVDTQKMQQLVKEQGDYALALIETRQASEALSFRENDKELTRFSNATGIAKGDIDALNAALSEHPNDPYYQRMLDLTEANQNIQDTILNLQALEEELRKSQSDMGRYQLAQQTANPSDNMQTIRSGMESAKKLWDQGWIGKDDFTTFADLIATNAQRGTDEAVLHFKENYDAIQKYMTENADGVHQWVDDIRKLAPEYIKLNKAGEEFLDIDSMEKFSTQMGRSKEFAEAMLMAMKDAGYEINLKVVGDEFANSFKDIDYMATNAGQQVKGLVNEMQDLAESGIDVSSGAEEATNALNQLSVADPNFDATELLDQLNAIGNYNGFNIAINPDTGQFEISFREVAQEIREQYKKEPIKIPLTAGELGEKDKGSASEVVRTFVGDDAEELKKNYVDTFEAISKAEKDSTVSLKEYADKINEFSQEDFDNIVWGDNQLAEGSAGQLEGVLDGLISSLGISQDQAISLMQVLHDMGLIEIEPTMDVDASDVETAKEEIESIPEEKEVKVSTVVEKARDSEYNQRQMERQLSQEMVLKAQEQAEREEQFAPAVEAIESTTSAVEGTTEAVESQTGELSGAIEGVANAISEKNQNETNNTNETTPSNMGRHENPNPFAYKPKGSALNSNRESTAESLASKQEATFSAMQNDSLTIFARYQTDDSAVQETNEEIENNPPKPEVEYQTPEIGDQQSTVSITADTSNLQGVDIGDTSSTHYFNGDTSGVENAASDAKAAEESVPSEKTVVFQGRDQASAVAERVKSAVSTVVGKTIDITANVTGLSNISSLKSMIDNLRDKTVNIVSNVVNKVSSIFGGGGATGTAHVSHYYGTAYAHGTAYDMWEDYRHSKHAWAKGTPEDWELPHDEDALVNEVGTESIVRDGKWFEIPGGAHVESLKRGDIVFSAKQTEELKKYGKVYSGGGHGKVAYANGTAYNMMNAYRDTSASGGLNNRIVTQSKKNTGYQPASNSSVNNNTKAVKQSTSATNKGTKSTDDNNKKLDEFKKWLEKFVDWIEVRLDRLSNSIDNLSQKAENLVGFAKKNAEIDKALKLTGTGKEKYELQTAKGEDGVQRITGVSVKEAKKGTQIGDNLYGAQRYFKHAAAIREEAINKKLVSKNQADDIISKIQAGAIDIKDYNEEVREFITAYQEWYDKAMECVYAVDELKASQKDLAQQELDNVLDDYSALESISNAITGRAESMMKYYTSAGKAVNSKEAKKQLGNQVSEAQYMSGKYKQELDDYAKTLAHVLPYLKEGSVEYNEALAQYEELNQKYIDSVTLINDLNKQIADLDITKLGYVIDRFKNAGEKIAALVSLKNTRGTIYGDKSSRITESDYSRQASLNNDVIKLLNDRMNKNIVEAAKYDIDSENYKEYYDAIVADEQEIIKLIESNEELKKSIRDLRWKPFNELQETINNTIEDLDHLRGLMKSEQFFDDDKGTEITARGYANIALIAQQMAKTKKQIADYREALNKLQQEYKNGNISLETYNETSREYVKTIQSGASQVESYKDALVEMYKTQITNENKALQDVISKRKEALSAKKAYYDYDKKLKSENKDLNNLRAQINALQGVTNDAGMAELARLRAQLAEKEADHEETLRQHSFDMQQEGYQQLSDDANETLEQTLNAVESNSVKQEEVVNLMLERVKGNYKTAYDEIKGIISETGTAISEDANGTINQISTAIKTVLSEAEINIGATFDTIANKIAQTINTAQIQVNNAATKKTEQNIKSTNAVTAINNAKNTATGKANTAAINANTKKVEATKSATQAVKDATPKVTAQPAKTNTQQKQQEKKEEEPALTGPVSGIKETLKKGARGKNVKQLQKALNKLGFKDKNGKKLKVDGVFGPLTLSSLKKFQKAMGVTKSGKLDLATKQAFAKKGYKMGTLGTLDDELNFTHEGEIIRRSDGAILRQLPAGTQVIPKAQSENLMKWADISPNSLRSLGDIQPVSNVGVTNHYDALINIQGNVDSSVMDRLEDVAHQLLNNRAFKTGTINMVTKEFQREWGKAGK